MSFSDCFQLINKHLTIIIYGLSSIISKFLLNQVFKLFHAFFAKISTSFVFIYEKFALQFYIPFSFIL